MSYASPHPPFTVPERFYNMYPLEDVPMPTQWDTANRPNHSALNHIRRVDCLEEPVDEDFVRRTVAGYCGLITHVDEQIGKVIEVARDIDLLDTTCLLYTSDHGEAAGNHGMFGKSTLYEHSIGVPLIMRGPGIPKGRVVKEIVSHVDLFDTILETPGVMEPKDDYQRSGISLWPAIRGKTKARIGFSEVHVKSTKNAAYMIRDADMKLIYHVDAPKQLFDLRADPMETQDLANDPNYADLIIRLEVELRKIVDPEAVNVRAKAEQLKRAKSHGGPKAILKMQNITMSPPPTVEA